MTEVENGDDCVKSYIYGIVNYALPSHEEASLYISPEVLTRIGSSIEDAIALSSNGS